MNKELEFVYRLTLKSEKSKFDWQNLALVNLIPYLQIECHDWKSVQITARKWVLVQRNLAYEINTVK